MRKLILMALAAGVMMSMASCDKDSNETGPKKEVGQVAASVAGTYNVNCLVPISPENPGLSIPAKLKITGVAKENAEEVVKFELIDFKMPQMGQDAEEENAGEILVTVDEMPLKGSLGNVSIAFKGKALVSGVVAGSNLGVLMDCEADGTIVARATPDMNLKPGQSKNIDELQKLDFSVVVTVPGLPAPLTININNEKSAQ